jgi:hypothetical protein
VGSGDGLVGLFEEWAGCFGGVLLGVGFALLRALTCACVVGDGDAEDGGADRGEGRDDDAEDRCCVRGGRVVVNDIDGEDDESCQDGRDEQDIPGGTGRAAGFPLVSRLRPCRLLVRRWWSRCSFRRSLPQCGLTGIGGVHPGCWVIPLVGVLLWIGDVDPGADSDEPVDAEVAAAPVARENAGAVERDELVVAWEEQQSRAVGVVTTVREGALWNGIGAWCEVVGV